MVSSVVVEDVKIIVGLDDDLNMTIYIAPILILQNDKRLILRPNKIHFSLCKTQEWNTVNGAKHKVCCYALRFYFLMVVRLS